MSYRARLILLVVVLLAIAVVIALISGPSDKPSTEVDITVPTPFCGSADRSRCETVIKADKDNNLEPGEQKEAVNAGLDLHEDTRDETPPGVTPAQLAAGKRATEALAKKELLKPERPAGAQTYSCKKRPVVNQSPLTERRKGVMMHFTVSDPGSLNAIFGLFNRRAFGASSNYGYELLTNKCEQWVPDNRKAWAQLAANSAYLSVEMVTKDRSRAEWLATPAFKTGKLAALVRDKLRLVGAPLRLVDPVGCVWTPGLTDHNRAECGNNHWDVGRNFPWPEFLAQVKRGSSPSPLTAVQRTACNRLQFHRKRAHGIGSWSTARAARAAALKKLIPMGRCESRFR